MRKYLHKALFLALLCAFVMLLETSVFADERSDFDLNYYERGKVARISLIRGDVQVRRKTGNAWESGTANLPLVEGDKIVTGNNARAEVQIGKNNFLRINENSLVSFVTLRDEGTALSIPEGTISLRLGRFDRTREYFEIDATKTTIALEKEGLYRLDAPSGNREDFLQIAVTGGGQAKVYTENSTFSIRNGRSARVFLDGDNAGEYQMRAASSFNDDWDRWVAEREYQIEQRRRLNSYQAYYDEDIFGADELYEYGEWIYTRKYGYVWRPYRNYTVRYSNWSPYRYGHWRWLPFYGWTWISDEPWGWSTSYYGRWVYVSGSWVWLPRDYFGHRRWQPALVIFSYYGYATCWYPIPYYYGYSYYGGKRNIIVNNVIINNTTIIVNNQNPNQKVYEGRERRPPIPAEYLSAITKIESSSFGVDTKGNEAVSADIAREIVKVEPIGGNDSRIPMPPLAQNSDIKVRPDREIIGKSLPLREAVKELDAGKIGAMPRESGIKLEERLEIEKGFGNRQPIERKPRENGAEETEKGTGVFDRSQRPPISQPRNDEQKGSGFENSERPVRRPPINSDDQKAIPPVRRDDNENQPERKPRSQPSQPPRNDDRKYDDDNYNRRPMPRQEPPREERRYDPPLRQEPRQEPRRESPPPREEPRKESPPPSKSDDGDHKKDN